MRFLTQVVVFALLALWLPATLHCTLEAAGLLAVEVSHEGTDSCCNTDQPCSQDGCDVIKSGLIKTASASLKVPSPDFSTCLCFLCVQLSLPASLKAPVARVLAEDRPINWVPTWQFVRRAAPPARAPDCAV